LNQPDVFFRGGVPKYQLRKIIPRRLSTDLATRRDNQELRAPIGDFLKKRGEMSAVVCRNLHAMPAWPKSYGLFRAFSGRGTFIRAYGIGVFLESIQAGKNAGSVSVRN
jgi:hypothetical protein